MDSFEFKNKRLIFARFDKGEDLLNSLKQCALEHNIKSGWFNIIGGLKELAYGLYEDGEYRNINKYSNHCFELLPTFGNITQKENNILVHAHVVAADENHGVVFGGHLIEGCKIFPFAEVVIQEVDGVVGRIYDKSTNLWPICFKK